MRDGGVEEAEGERQGRRRPGEFGGLALVILVVVVGLGPALFMTVWALWSWAHGTSMPPGRLDGGP
ncbi:hypothetical protein [Kitasatospora sp. MBT63]|uniref:hypothetical protein n=1 Tax=Kitasatospora sp. MBT63 TaxID=1444768 RepID=UPI00053A3E08|nr:hypothetical protein [Kitasatospora sp. MBT63]